MDVDYLGLALDYLVLIILRIISWLASVDYLTVDWDNYYPQDNVLAGIC